jgi:peptidoglycan-N-acetylglucosamine deacetylase
MNPWWIAAPTIVTGMAGLTAYGAVCAPSQLFGPVICTTDSPRVLALTFDDGPNPSVTPKLLDLLDRYKAKATFFVIGQFARQCPELLKETNARGHIIGNHTQSHPNLFFCGAEETRIELQRCSESIQNIILAWPRFFRPPFGYRSPWLSEIVHSQNMRMVTWSLLPGDWRAKPVDWLTHRMHPVAAALQKKALANSPGARRPMGHVLCLHDGNYRKQHGDRSVTVAALEFWLPRWHDLGFEFVTMADAERHSA